jgi:hypothetical protein
VPRVLVLCAVFGLVLGAGSLVRPTFPALLVLTAVAAVMKAPSWKPVSFGMVVAALCMALAIAPWTIRNYREYGRFCLVAAGGGFSLLGVVHPLSDGVNGYQTPGLGKGLDVVARDQLSMKLAWHFIFTGPQRTARFAVQKLIREWGCDTSSIIDDIVGVPPRGGERAKHVIQAVLAVFWGGFVCAWALSAIRRGWINDRSAASLWAVLWLLTIFSLHLLFEPQARYHYPVLPFVAGVIALAFLRPTGISIATATVDGGGNEAIAESATRFASAGL